MSASTPNAFLNIDDAHLRVTSGNVYAQGLNISGVSFSGVSGLHTVTNTGNVTTNTLEFKNGAKAFVATSNVEVKGSLDVANVATIYNGSNADYDQKQKFTSTVSSSGNYFANTLAMSTNGLYAIVGAHGENKTYTFTRSGSTWTQEHTFSSTGYAVDISSHGTYAVVGANGSASVFYRSSGSTWDSGTTLTAAGISVTTGYGASVSISDDGSYAIVGATGQSAAWIFRRTGTTTWDAGVKIALTGFSLGFSVAISGDGLYALLGAHAQHTAYVFKRTGAYLWSQQAKITESDSFGYSVALSTDGSRALIGATGGNGKAYSYERAGSGWSQNAIITASDAASGDAFGSAVSLSSDGSYGIVGAPGSEKAYTFKNAGSVWTELGIETASDTASGHVFGRSVSISGDGIYALIGASGNEAAYSYERKETLVLDVRGEANVRTLNVSDDLIVTNNILASNNLTVAGNLNVTTIRSDSNVVTEYTGPHDRPLRKYPEVALTANSDKGYVAIGSSNGSGSYPEYTAFDGVVTNSTTGWASDGTYASGTGISTFSWNGSFGEYLSLELPKALRLQKMFLKGYEHSGIDYQNAPRDIKLYGSNNETNWVLLKTETDLPIDSITNNSTYININATEHYKYIRLQITKTYRRTAAYTRIGELEYYGHEEGSGSLDTTLKTVYNVPATTGTQLEVYYDAKGESTVQSPIPDLSPNTNTGAVVGHSPTLDETDGIDSFKFNGSSQYITSTHGLSVPGQPVHSQCVWFKITGDTSDYQYISIIGTTNSTNQAGLVLLNDGTTLLGNYYGGERVITTITQNVWYHAVLVYTGTTTDAAKYYINGVEVITTGLSGAAPITPTITGTTVRLGANTSGGQELNGSIANFRLYSKALNADQVKELYDYQKDYFLGSKSQVTLYKGHLGVGVTEPSGQLELAGDERIQEYPPRGLTGYETLVEGHGTFCAYASSVRNSSWEAWEAFNGLIDTSSRWISADTYTGTEDAYSGSARLYSSAPLGEYVVLKMPYPIKLNKARVYALSGSPNTNNNRQGPERGEIWGSNDGVTWEHVTNYDFGDYQQEQWNEINNINSTKYYSQYGFIVTKKLNNTYTASGATQGDYVAITEIQYFGTPGPTTLDKGSLTLGRSLDVPRVSRYDVDTETPRPEKLVLDFDTTVNSSPTDISGKGNHGVFKGNAVYSAADKAFKFDGEDAGPADYIIGNLNNTGDTDFTVSLWLKKDRSGTYGTLWNFGGSGGSGNPEDSVAVQVTSGDRLDFFIFSGAKIEISNFGVDYLNKWVHIVATRTGIDLKIYLDGVDQNLSITGTAPTHTLQLAANTEYTIGARGTGSLGTNSLSGYISNFKVYDVVLEPSEVKKLYNLGRTGRSMVISDTAVGIGKAPEAQLDVRGNISCDGVFRSENPIAFEAYYTDGTLSTTGTYLPNYVRYNYGGCYEQSTGRFYAPINGIYAFHWHAYTNQGDSTSRIFIDVNGSDRGQKGNSLKDMGQQLSFSIYLNAGDYLIIKGKNAYPLYFHGHLNHNMYSGHLVIAM